MDAVPPHVVSGWPVAHRQTKTAERYALQGGGGATTHSSLFASEARIDATK